MPQSVIASAILTITDNDLINFSASIITISAARAVHVANMNNDSDLDIVSAFYNDNTIASNEYLRIMRAS